MDDSGEEYLVSTIKVEETQIECNGQEHLENVNPNGFVEGPSAANAAEASSSSISLTAILEHLTSTTHAVSSTVANKLPKKRETQQSSVSGLTLSSLLESSREEIPPAAKRGRDMTDPEYRDFVVNSFTTLIGLTKRLCESVEKLANPISQVATVNGESQVVHVDLSREATPVNPVIPDCVDRTLNAEIPSLADGKEIDVNSNPSLGDRVVEIEESSSESELENLKRPVTVIDLSDDDEDDGTANCHVQPSRSQPPSKKPKLQKMPNMSAFAGRVCTYKIGNEDSLVDPAQFLNRKLVEIHEILMEELTQKKCIKVILLMKCKMKKAIEKTDSILSTYRTGPTTLYHGSNIPSLLGDMFENIMREYTDKLPKGSGWTLEKICELVIRVARFSPLKGGSHVKTPACISGKRCIINVRNRDYRCFEYAILSLFLPVKNRNRVPKYHQLQHNVNFKGLPMPMPVECISQFEKLNPKFSVNVYELDSDESIHPIRVTEIEKENHRDLLLLHSEDGKKHHYCCITQFSRLMAGRCSVNNRAVSVCKKCFTKFYRNRNTRLEAHKRLCNAKVRTVIELPKRKDDNIPPVCKFKSHIKSYQVPFIVYADILSYDDPVSSLENTRKPVPLSVACYVHTHLEKQHCGNVALGYKLFEGVDCLKKFVSHIESVTENIGKMYKSPIEMDDIGLEKKLELSNQTVCHICDIEFKENDETSTDYDHLTGEKRGRSHAMCNLNFRLPVFVPVFFHDVDKQVIQNLICELGHGESEVQINSQNSETYISFQKKIGSIYIRFLDTFHFMSEDLEQLVKYLPADELKITNKEFHGRNVSLLKGNQVCFKEYIENFVHPNEMLSLPFSALSSTLLELKTSQADYQQTSNVVREFKIKSLGELWNHHLKSRVTLLADVFENFRSICFKHFYLDPCNYHTMQGITFDSALKQSRVELELLTDPAMFSMVKAGVRDDFVQVVTKHMKANNENCVDYDHDMPMSHLLYVEANSIYATQMLEPLPIGGFKFMEPDKYDSESIMNLQDEGELGYIFEVSLKYPHDLHDAHSDHPFCQELRAPPKSKVKLLLGTFEDKDHYVVHFRVLKQALESGLTLKKIHRVLQFKQSKWLKPVVEKITQLGQEAPDEFSKRFSKWALDSIHGEFLEDIRDKKSFTLVFTKDKLQKKLNKYNFFDFHICSEKCVAVLEDQQQVTFDQPVYVGMTIMDLVKMQMNHFFYDVMKKQFGPRVTNCYEDSDTFILSVESAQIDEELLKIKEHFDFSNYPVGHLLHSESNKEKLGTFKNMAVSNPILSFDGVRNKCFVIQQRDPDKNVEL